MSARRARRKKELKRIQEGSSDLCLIPIDDSDEIFAAFGSGDLARLGPTTPLVVIGETSSMNDQLSMAIHAGNVAAQLGQGVLEARGLVHLAPETLRALRHGAAPMVKDGWNLGTLAASDGKFAQQVRWLPARGAQGAKVLAALGPAAALMALQFKMGAIQRAIDNNISLTHNVLRELRAERWAEIEACYEQLLRSYELAVHVGEVTQHSSQELAGQGIGLALEKHRRLSLHAVQRHRDEMRRLTLPSDRREYLSKYGDAIFNDSQSLLKGEDAWLIHEALRVASRQRASLADETTAREMNEIMRRALADRDDRLGVIRPLMQGVYQDMRLLENSPGSAGLFALGDKRRAPKDVAAAAKQLAGALADGGGVVDPTIRSDDVMWMNVDQGPELLDRLRWLLLLDERVLAVLWGSTHGALTWDGDGYLVFTDRRLVLLSRNDFFKTGSVRRELAWSRLDGLTLSNKPGAAGGHDLVTRFEAKALFLQSKRATTRDEMEALRKLVERGLFLSSTNALEIEPTGDNH